MRTSIAITLLIIGAAFAQFTIQEESSELLRLDKIFKDIPKTAIETGKQKLIEKAQGGIGKLIDGIGKKKTKTLEEESLELLRLDGIFKDIAQAAIETGKQKLTEKAQGGIGKLIDGIGKKKTKSLEEDNIELLRLPGIFKDIAKIAIETGKAKLTEKANGGIGKLIDGIGKKKILEEDNIELLRLPGIFKDIAKTAIETGKAKLTEKANGGIGKLIDGIGKKKTLEEDNLELFDIGGLFESVAKSAGDGALNKVTTDVKGAQEVVTLVKILTAKKPKTQAIPTTPEAAPTTPETAPVTPTTPQAAPEAAPAQPKQN